MAASTTSANASDGRLIATSGATQIDSIAGGGLVPLGILGFGGDRGRCRIVGEVSAAVQSQLCDWRGVTPEAGRTWIRPRGCIPRRIRGMVSNAAGIFRRRPVREESLAIADRQARFDRRNYYALSRLHADLKGPRCTTTSAAGLGSMPSSMTCSTSLPTTVSARSSRIPSRASAACSRNNFVARATANATASTKVTTGRNRIPGSTSPTGHSTRRSKTCNRRCSRTGFRSEPESPVGAVGPTARGYRLSLSRPTDYSEAPRVDDSSFHREQEI